MNQTNSSLIRKLLRVIKARPRLTSCALLGFAVGLLLHITNPHFRIATVFVVGWNVGAITFLIFTLKMMYREKSEKTLADAIRHDEGHLIVLSLVVAACAICLTAIISIQSASSEMAGYEKQTHIALAAMTILTSWAFTHVMYALHYAHEYYLALLRHQPPGIDFPGKERPTYVDFLYFSCIIGTSGQTADVSFTDRHMRSIGLWHCVLSFFFNTTVLALAINIAAGLI